MGGQEIGSSGLENAVVSGTHTTSPVYVGQFPVTAADLEPILGIKGIMEATRLVPFYAYPDPFIAVLPASLSMDQRAGLYQLGYEYVEVRRNQALAMFIDGSRVRNAELLFQNPGYLDKKIGRFMAEQAGNHGKMYFIGPKSDHETEIAAMLSPEMVDIHSSYCGIPIGRVVHNLIGKMPDGTYIHRKGTTVLIVPHLTPISE